MENMREMTGQNNDQQKLHLTQVGISFVGYLMALAAVLGLLALELVFMHCLKIK